MGLLLRVLNVLLVIAFVVLIYYVAIWVLGMLGVMPPEPILKVCLVIVGLLAAIYALSGQMDGWWAGWNRS